MKTVKVLILALVLFAPSLSYAHKVYTPPPEIQCWLTTQQILFCGSLNPHYFMPFHTTAKFEGSKVIVFTFKNARAHFVTDELADVVMTYQNAKGEEMEVKNLYSSYIPYVSTNGWRFLEDNWYGCEANAAACPILVAKCC